MFGSDFEKLSQMSFKPVCIFFLQARTKKHKRTIYVLG
jgi:hypothetical protein